MRDAASGPFRVGSRSYLCLYMLLMEVCITLTLTHHH